MGHKNLILDFIDVESKEDSETILDFVKQTLAKYNLYKKLLAVATDNAATMVSFMTKLKEFMRNTHKTEIYHIRCAAHILNLIASVLYDSSEMKDAICVIRDAIEAVRRSSKLEHKFEQYVK